jgi:hypothetical protein
MFRRRKGAVDADGGPATEEESASADPRAAGPWDVTEVDLDEELPRVDLGSLLLTPHEGLEVQIQVDEQTGDLAAVLLVGPEGAAELRAFAAPRNGDIWEDVRRSVAAEVAQLGGTATEAPGEFGTDLVVSMMVPLPDGQLAQQQSRVVGIAGPRWLLRVTLFGRPAVQPLPDGDVERALRDVVVVRGGTPMPPGDALPLTMPPDVQPVDPA